MDKTLCKAIYQLVTTPAAEVGLCKDASTVYSVLALYAEDDTLAPCFVYDISREKETAERIVDRLQTKNPTEAEIFDFISELI